MGARKQGFVPALGAYAVDSAVLLDRVFELQIVGFVVTDMGLRMICVEAEDLDDPAIEPAAIVRVNGVELPGLV